ncbi:MAG: hypothetical protein HYV33_03680 [Candidatus Kerfeldbacteria bacterium]|nr:hypothetical protein [Candidatus Kerfeldbacteria bacterium]
MELKHHIHYLQQSAWFIVMFALIVGCIAGFVSWRRPAVFKVVQTYQVQLINRSSTVDYQYGSYYDLKGAEIFTQYLMSVLRSPAVIEAIYQQAALPYEIDNLSRFTNQFRTDQDSAQQFTVTFSQQQQTAAEALAGGMTAELNTLTAQAELDDRDQPLWQLQALPPVLVYQPSQPGLAVLLGTVAGALGAVVLVYIKRYLQAD